MQHANLTEEQVHQITYGETEIKSYEFIFGKGHISTGGEKFCQEFVKILQVQPGDKILDIGSGLGGAAFQIARLAKTHGYNNVQVHGVDVSYNMHKLASQYLDEMDQEVQEHVTFELNNILRCEFEPNTFDIVYSRDSIYHIADKEQVFNKILKWLKPGGKLVFTDICDGGWNHHSFYYEKYLSDYMVSFNTISTYTALLSKAGFMEIESEDITRKCLEIVLEELGRCQQLKSEFLKLYDIKYYNHIAQHWESKKSRYTSHENLWGLFRAKKL